MLKVAKTKIAVFSLFLIALIGLSVFVFAVVDNPKSVKIFATKIICDSESDLPNWGGGGEVIDASTAQDYVSSHSGVCHFESGWDFQWAFDASNPGDNIEQAGSPWAEFGPTNSSGETSVVINNAESGKIKLREELKSGYILFSGVGGSNVTAEFYCDGDVLNYDNYDFINDPIVDGSTYYCVAFNVAVEAPECTTDAECSSLNGQCAVGSCSNGSCVANNLPDSTGPVTSNLIVTKVLSACEVKISAIETDMCSAIQNAEYFKGGATCGAEGTGTPLDATDGIYNSLIEDVVKNSVGASDGGLNVFVRGQDIFGNWGVCEAVHVDLDCLPPNYPTCNIGNTNPNSQNPNGILINGQCNPNEILVCGNNTTLAGNVCDSQSTIQLAEYFLDNMPLLDWNGINMTASDGNYLDEQCEDVQATINLGQLSEGTHYVQLHGKDAQETWGKLNQPSNPLISFIKDTTPPKTEKTINFAGDVHADCSNATQANGHSLTNGCYYVKPGTQITLSANDFNPDENTNGGYNDLSGEYAGNVVINWNIYYSQDCTVGNPQWSLNSSGTGQINQDVLLTLNQDSCHLIEYWAVDGVCGNAEAKHYELDIVDSKAPITTKNVSDPKIAGNGNPIHYYINSDTDITLNCADQQPHPTNAVKLNWELFYSQDCNTGNWGNPINGSVEQDGNVVISNLQTSCHKLEYWCEDALGNAETPQVEVDAVDNDAPIITKTIVGPSEGQCPPRPNTNNVCYIDGVTDIHVNVTDPQPHPVDQVQCRWRYNVDGGQYILGGQGVGANFVVHFPEESSHNLVIECQDALGNRVTDSETFLVDKTPPVTTKTYGKPFFSTGLEFSLDDLEELGNGDASWTTNKSQLDSYSAKLYVLNGSQDWAGVDAAVDITLQDINSLAFWEFIDSYNPNGFSVNVILGVDADGDGVFESDLEAWHITSPHNPSALGDDTFIEMDGVQGNPTTGVWTNTNAYNTAQWWTVNAAGNGFAGPNDANCYNTLSTVISNCAVNDRRFEPTDKVKLIKILIGGSSSWNDETAYVDNVVLNGNVEINEPTPNGGVIDWINSRTPITLTVNDTGPHKSGIAETNYRVTLVADAACNSDSVCQQTAGAGNFLPYSSPFTIAEESCHLIEYYSVDNVDKTEAVKKQCVFVDNKEPLTNKVVGEPQYLCDEGEDKCGPEGTPVNTWENLYVNSSTPITLSCADQLPHPVDHSELCFAVSWHGTEDNGEGFRYITQNYVNGGHWLDESQNIYCVDLDQNQEFVFNFKEDSLHNLEWFCQDALGNKGTTNIEYDNVDNQPPQIIVHNPTPKEAENVTRCTQSIVVETLDAKSGVNESTVYSDLVHSNGSVVEHILLTKSVYGTFEGLMSKEQPVGNYTLKVCASDNLGNQYCKEIKEYLPEMVSVEFINPSECVIDPENGGTCDFAFNLCMRDGNSVQFWMNKFGNAGITPDMMNALISSTLPPDSALVGLKHPEPQYDTEGECLSAPTFNGVYVWENNLCYWQSNAEILSLEVEPVCHINGKDVFNLHLNIDSETAGDIGAGIHDLKYWIKTSMQPNNCQEL